MKTPKYNGLTHDSGKESNAQGASNNPISTMKSYEYNGFKSKDRFENALSTFAHLLSYFPENEADDEECGCPEGSVFFKIYKGDSLLCCVEGVDCIAFAVIYGKRLVCLLEVMTPDYENEDPEDWSPQVLSQVGFIEGIDYNELFADFYETAYCYLLESWDEASQL